MFEQALLEKFWPKVKQRIILIFYPGLDKKKKDEDIISYIWRFESVITMFVGT